MAVIGFIHYRKKPTNKAYAYAAVAKAEGAELLYFSPGAVDFKKRKINGYEYQNGEWANVIRDFPDVICNVIGFSSEKQDKIVERLYGEIPVTSYSIGSKAVVYKNLTRYKEFTPYLVPSEEVFSAAQVLRRLDQCGEIVLKPSSGCQGNGVLYIGGKDGLYTVLSETRTAYDRGELSDFIAGRIGGEKYIVQPYVNCRTKAGNAYDFRLHTQKNAAGEWAVARIYPRVAEAGGIVCNISRGGYTADLTTFLKREFGDDSYNIQKYMEEFSLQLAAHMDRIQRELYQEELDELGIDIGFDANKKIRVYEINWRPGYPPSMDLDLTVVKNAIRYSMLLAKKGDIK